MDRLPDVKLYVTKPTDIVLNVQDGIIDINMLLKRIDKAIKVEVSDGEVGS